MPQTADQRFREDASRPQRPRRTVAYADSKGCQNMLDKSSLPQGLRHVLVLVTLGSVFPPVSSSESDIALLRAANRAMQRKSAGCRRCLLVRFGWPPQLHKG